MTPAGRFAPSPSGDLHIGNLRTALLAWLFARTSGRRFLIRIEDLDPVRSRPEFERSQLDDLSALGIDWDGEPVRQSERREFHDQAIARLERAGLTYPCWCTRADLAVSAPHGDQQRYPGTCRDLPADRVEQLWESGRQPCLRARLDGTLVEWTDGLLGPMEGVSGDPVIRRADSTPSYCLAVVIDDADQGIDQVVRGDDLAASVPEQAALARALGLESPGWVHVPLALGPSGKRLAKRDGAITLAQRAGRGFSAAQTLAMIGSSLGLCSDDEQVAPADLLERFRPEVLPREPWSPEVA